MNKIKFFLIFAPFILSGCSTFYRVTDYGSREKFYDEYNNFAHDKKVEITLRNDSSFYSEKITAINNDTLYEMVNFVIYKDTAISVNEIGNISYSGNLKSADILLKNGTQISAEDITFANGIVKFRTDKYSVSEKAITGVDNIKSIYYKKNWPGIISGIPIGTALGFITGIMGVYPVYSDHPDMGTTGETKTKDYAGSIVIGTGIGTVLGGIAGWFIGYNYTFIFN